MSIGAKVESIEALSGFRVALVKFQEDCTAALGDAESDVHAALRWLENDQVSHWSSQIRQRQELVARAAEAVRQKQLFKDSSGRQQSAIEEQKALAKAQARLAEAEQKLAATKQWIRRLQKELTLYKGQTQRFTTTVTQEVPSAIKHIGALEYTLKEYLAMQPGAEMELQGEQAAFFSGGAGEPSMARGRAGMAPAAGGAGHPDAALRRRTLSPPSRMALAAIGKVPPEWVAAKIADSGIEKLEVEWAPPGDGDRVILTRDATKKDRIFLERVVGAQAGDSGWFIGTVDVSESPAETVKVADVLKARPDFTKLLALPQGYLAVVDASGVAAVLDEKDQEVLAEVKKGAAT
jgi:hypothetical protein